MTVFKGIATLLGASLILLTSIHASTLSGFIADGDFDGLRRHLAGVTPGLLKRQLDARDAAGRTPLIEAAYAGDYNMAKTLVNAGASVDVRDRNNRDLINIAIRMESPELAKLFIDSGTSVTAYTRKYLGSTLIFASDRGQVDIVDLLIKAGAPLDRVNVLGWNALLETVVLGDGSEPYQRIVQLLVDAGADTTIGDSDGITPLVHARRRGLSEIVDILQ